MKVKEFFAGMVGLSLFVIAAAYAENNAKVSPDSYFITTGFEGMSFKAQASEAQTGPVPEVPVVEASQAQLPANIPVGNFGTVDLDASRAPEDLLAAQAYRGGSLDNEAAYKFMGTLGVNFVINLQSSHHEDQAACSRFGLNCRDFSVLPFDHLRLGKSGDFRGAFNFAVDELKAGKKIYIHCMKGKDRTGALAAALTIRSRACGREFDKAQLKTSIEASLDQHRFWRKNYPGWLSEIRGWVDDFEGNKAWLCR
jgi:hypothetical protein